MIYDVTHLVSTLSSKVDAFPKMTIFKGYGSIKRCQSGQGQPRELVQSKENCKMSITIYFFNDFFFRMKSTLV